MSWTRWCSWCHQKLVVPPTGLCLTCHAQSEVAHLMVEDLLEELFPEPTLEEELLSDDGA